MHRYLISGYSSMPYLEPSRPGSTIHRTARNSTEEYAGTVPESGVVMPSTASGSPLARPVIDSDCEADRRFGITMPGSPGNIDYGGVSCGVLLKHDCSPFCLPGIRQTGCVRQVNAKPFSGYPEELDNWLDLVAGHQSGDVADARELDNSGAWAGDGHLMRGQAGQQIGLAPAQQERRTADFVPLPPYGDTAEAPRSEGPAYRRIVVQSVATVPAIGMDAVLGEVPPLILRQLAVGCQDPSEIGNRLGGSAKRGSSSR